MLYSERVEDVIQDVKTGSDQGYDLISSDEPEIELMAQSGGNRGTISSVQKPETVKISYPAPHPLDQSSLRLYQELFDGKLGHLLESSAFQKCLRCLPPNDSRVALKVSRELFLALFLEAILSEDSLQVAEGACLRLLNDLSLESSEIYVEDYSHHSKGKSARWGCHQKPQFWVQQSTSSEVVSDSSGFGQYEWPVHWTSHRKDEFPYRPNSVISAPWCRFM